MSAPTLQAQIDTANAYEALSVPALLGQWAPGVASADITTHHGTARFPSIRTMVEADLRGWLPVMGVILTEDQIGRILQEAEHALSSYATTDGRVTFHLSAYLVTTKKP